jgi:hypothetical protein
MKFDPTKPVQTRDGKPARILATDLAGNAGSRPIAAAIMENYQSDDWEVVRRYTSEGVSPYGGNDLINIPEERELDVWLNVYPDGQPYQHGFLHDTRRGADNANAARSDRIACVHIKQKYHVGDGLDG